MLLVSHQHFVARLHVYAVGDVVVSLGGVADQREFIAIAADEGGQRIAVLVPRTIAPDRVVLGIGLVHLLFFGVLIEDGAQYRRRTGADGAVVEVDLVRRNEVLLAQLGPVGVFVVGELAAIGQGSGIVRKLS